MLILLIAYMLPDRAESADGNTPISRLHGHVSLPLYIPIWTSGKETLRNVT